MMTSPLTALLTFFSLGTPALLGCAFCEESRGYYPRYEMAQAAPVARGERIQPLAPKLPTTNSAEVGDCCASQKVDTKTDTKRVKEGIA